MESLPYLLAYLSFTISLTAIVARVIRWSRLPLHLRWELYPVANEPRVRAKYGGSYLENSEWWNKPRTTSKLGELRVMIPELLFLVALKEHNRQLWFRSFPFHFGLYLAAMATSLALVLGVLHATAPGLLDAPLPLPGTVVDDLARWAILGFGVSGLLLGTLGALGLLHRRLSLPELRAASTPADFFNLAFFIVAFGCALLTFALVDPGAHRALAFAEHLTAFNLEALPGAGAERVLPLASVVLLSLLVAYIPLTHMSHFVSKYFAYHGVRWNGEPHLGSSAEAKQIGQLLDRKVTWAADHIQGEGQKTWLEVALENPEGIKS